MFKLSKYLENIFVVRNLKRFLFLINISIFLSIFAATAAVISIFIEIEINKKEMEMIEIESDLDFWGKISDSLPLYFTNADTVYITDLNLNRTYKVYESLPKFDNLVSFREFYFNRALSLHRYIDYGYGDLTGTNMQEFIDDLNYFYSNEDDTGFNQWMLEYIDTFYTTHKKLENDYSLYDQKSTEIKFPSKDEVFPDNEDDLYDFYHDFHQLGFDRHENWEQLLDIFSISSVDAIFQLQYTQIELGNEIEKLSNYEVWIIFIAFIIQVIVFILIQFFELGVISRERNK